jgi:hypothetical protein
MRRTPHMHRSIQVLQNGGSVPLIKPANSRKTDKAYILCRDALLLVTISAVCAISTVYPSLALRPSVSSALKVPIRARTVWLASPAELGFQWAKLVRVWCVTSLTLADYTGCPRRNVPDFGRMFLMLKYTDITQNTYIQSWTVTEIMVREVLKYGSCYTLIDYQIDTKTGRNMWFLISVLNL